jgi:hypothetical protein
MKKIMPAWDERWEGIRIAFYINRTNYFFMNLPKKQMDGTPDKTARSNQRRLVILMVVIFIVVISFFAGRYSQHKPDTTQDATGGNTTDPSGREGIPPDSLHH